MTDGSRGLWLQLIVYLGEELIKSHTKRPSEDYLHAGLKPLFITSLITIKHFDLKGPDGCLHMLEQKTHPALYVTLRTNFTFPAPLQEKMNHQYVVTVKMTLNLIQEVQFEQQIHDFEELSYTKGKKKSSI